MDIDISAIDCKNVEIKDFIEFVDRELTNHRSLVRNNDYKKLAFATSNQTNFKKFFEEIVPLMLFLKREQGVYSKVKYMSGDQKGDAILDGEITVEITKAQNKNNYLKKQDMLKCGYAFSVKDIENKKLPDVPTKTKPYAYSNKEHIEDNCNYINSAIQKKIKNDYPNNSILIISFESDTLMLECDGDYRTLEKGIENLEKGMFYKIYIIEGLKPKWQYIIH